MNLGWSQFAYLELRKSSFSIPLDFEIAKVACNAKCWFSHDIAQVAKNKRQGKRSKNCCLRKKYEHYKTMPMQYTEIFKVVKN